MTVQTASADCQPCEHDPEAAPLRRREDEQAAEEVGAHGQQVVTERVELAAGRRLTAEPRLGQQPPHHDDARVREGEPVGPVIERDASGAPQRHRERGDEQHVLPGGEDVERRAAHAGVPGQRHDEVVHGQPHREHEQPHPGEAGAHAIATSVMPRLTMRTGPGNSPRRSREPSRWFSFAHGRRARS